MVKQKKHQRCLFINRPKHRNKLFTRMSETVQILCTSLSYLAVKIFSTYVITVPELHRRADDFTVE